jgi:hypothetical protein
MRSVIPALATPAKAGVVGQARPLDVWDGHD